MVHERAAREALARLLHHLAHAFLAHRVTALRDFGRDEHVPAHRAQQAGGHLIYEDHAISLGALVKHRVRALDAELLEHHGDVWLPPIYMGDTDRPS